MLVELMLMSIHRHEVLGAGFFGGTAVSGKRGTWVEMWVFFHLWKKCLSHILIVWKK